MYSTIISLFSNVAVIPVNLFANCPFANVSNVTLFPFEISSACISCIANCISSFISAFFAFSFALVALKNNPFYPFRAAMLIPARINNTIIVITNAINVIPLFFCNFIVCVNLSLTIFNSSFFNVFLSFFLLNFKLHT